MYKSKYKEWILDTIDQLRKRKARPDLERICHMVERKHGLSFDEIVGDLERLVDEEVVIKVDYKGSTSYRNAAKWRRGSAGSGAASGAAGTSHLAPSGHGVRILDAVQSVCEDDGYPDAGCDQDEQQQQPPPPPQLQQQQQQQPQQQPPETNAGASLQEIDDWLRQNDPGYDPAKHSLQSLLDREVQAKHLDRLTNGNYVVCADVQHGAESASSPSGSSGHAATNSIRNNTTPTGSASKASPGRKGRPPTKRKKIKKTLGPEFEHYSVVKKKRARGSSSGILELENVNPDPPVSTDPEPRCDYCLQTSACNKKGHPEELLICKDCQAKAHPSCMDYSEELAKRARTSPWQCIDCKTCYICEDAGDPDAMLFCDACDKGYHMSCHNPPLVDKPTGKWVCSQCVQELGLNEKDMMEAEDSQSNKDLKTDVNGDGMSCLPTPSDSPVTFQEDHKDFMKANDNVAAPIPMLATTLKSEYPDACDWTIDDVVRFFEELGFKEQAAVFREQEIDGKSLLLMKRSDVLTGLSLKLGPALKIYAHVQRLQTRGQNCF